MGHLPFINQYISFTLQPMVQRIIHNFPLELPTIDPAKLQLKICLEPCAVSFLLQDTNLILQAVEYFSWTLKDGDDLKQISVFLKEHSKLFNLNQLKTTIFYRTENVFFLPSELVSNARLLLQIQFGFKPGEGCLQKNINNEMVVAWKINLVWTEIFTEQFPHHNCQSSLAQLYSSLSFHEPDTIFLTFGNGLVESVVFLKQTLRLAKCFGYETITDLHYHLLNMCKQLKTVPSEVNIKVQGFIEMDSPLYRSLQTLFVDVQTINADIDNLPKVNEDLPAHYFTAIIEAK